MPFSYGFSEVGTDIVTPITSGTQAIASLAKRAYCSLYRNRPGAVTSTGEGVSNIIRLTMDAWCHEGNDSNLPPPPISQFSGGQCETLYTVKCVWDGAPRVQVSNVLGPVQSVACTKNPQNANAYQVVAIDATGTERQGNNFNVGTINFDEVEFERKDGGVDNCGSPPPEYPQEPPIVEGDRNFNYDITLNDGSVINVPVTVNVTNNNDVSFPTTIDVGGVTVSIDVGGITVGSNNTTNNFGGGGGGGFGSQDDEPPSVPPPSLDEDDLEEELKEPGESGEQTGIDRLLFVEIDIIQVPVNARAQSGSGSPDIYYAGWLEFSREGKYFPRQSIDFLGGVFEAPLDADGYAYTMKAGFAAQATVVRSKPEEPRPTGGEPVPV